MKTKTTLFIIFLFALISFSGCSQTKKNVSNKNHVILTDTIKAYLKEQEGKGFKGTVLIAKDNQIIVNKNFGDQSLTTNTAFYIASVTKQFVATAILKLQESGKLSVDDPITKFIDKVPLDKKEITIHHLLTHTSGLANNYSVDGITNRQKALDVILSSPLDYNIGEKYSYSGEAYNLLSIIIELVSGETYEQYILKNLFKPTNLNNTGFWGFETDEIARIASYNVPKIVDSLPSNIRNEEVNIANYGYRGGTGLFSTPQDLYKWINAVKYNGFLSQKSIQQLLKPYVNLKGNSTNGIFYAYGWRVEYKDGSLKRMTHGGQEDGLHDVEVSSYTNGDVIIVFSNSGLYEGEGRLNEREVWAYVLSKGLRNILESKSE